MGTPTSKKKSTGVLDSQQKRSIEMKNIELLIKAEKHLARSSMCYELLGSHGIGENSEIRKKAEYEKEQFDKLMKKVNELTS